MPDYHVAVTSLSHLEDAFVFLIINFAFAGCTLFALASGTTGYGKTGGARFSHNCYRRCALKNDSFTIISEMPLLLLAASAPFI